MLGFSESSLYRMNIQDKGTISLILRAVGHRPQVAQSLEFPGRFTIGKTHHPVGHILPAHITAGLSLSPEPSQFLQPYWGLTVRITFTRAGTILSYLLTSSLILTSWWPQAYCFSDSSIEMRTSSRKILSENGFRPSGFSPEYR